MSKAIAIDELSRKAERLLRPVWEENQILILEYHGRPVAEIVPLEEGRRWHFRSKEEPNSTADVEESPPAYELPAPLLADYDRLFNKKFEGGLTPEEEAEMAQVEQQLNEAEMATPLVQSITSRAEEEHERWMRRMDEVIAQLRELRQRYEEA